MATYCVSLGDGRRVSIAAYVNALRDAFENPAATFARGFRNPYATRGAVIVDEWRAAYTARLNGENGDRPQQTQRDIELGRFHRSYTTRDGRKGFLLRLQDVKCLPVSKRLKARILAAFVARVHGPDDF